MDCCINAFTLANGLWLGADVEGLVGWFLEHQMPEGGWNCEWLNGSTRSSYHSTLNSLRGLLAFDLATGGTDATLAARSAGEEYLLSRKLRLRLSTGDQVDHWATRFVYPFRWCYTVLNAADYFREASLLEGTAHDPRMSEAMGIIRDAREPDGTWIQEWRFPGRAWFEADVPAGEPSKWLTFYATRVLNWWDEAQPAAATE